MKVILKENLEKGERTYSLNSDKIARFHPRYEEALEELPGECYRITRQFVRPAAPIIFDNLIRNKVSIINETTFGKGEADIELARKFKENGYRISINVMATDIFESRLSCYERDSAMLLAGLTPRGCSKETQNKMYNSFVPTIQELEQLGLCDEINVYVRGENINKPPVVKYSTNSDNMVYRNFNEALICERAKQRKEILAEPINYLQRIKKAEEIISEYGTNEVLTKDSLKALKELEKDFISELGKDEVSK